MRKVLHLEQLLELSTLRLKQSLNLALVGKRRLSMMVSMILKKIKEAEAAFVTEAVTEFTAILERQILSEMLYKLAADSVIASS